MLRFSGKLYLSISFLFIFPINFFLERIPFMPFIYTLGQLLLCGTVFFFIAADPYFRLSGFVKLVFALDLIFLMSTLMNGQDLYYCVKQELKWTLAVIICEYALRKHPENLIISWYWLFGIYVLINTVSILLFPEALYPNNRGLWRCWFLGEDNAAVIYYLYAILFSYLYTLYIKKGELSTGVLLLVSSFAFFSFHNDIGTGKVCFAALVMLLAFYYSSPRKRELKLLYVIITQSIIFISIVLLQIQNRYADLIYKILGRDVTFTGRTFLWSTAIVRIIRTPFWGCGYFEPEQYGEVVGANILAGINSPHNTYLSIILYGGILAFGVLLTLMTRASFKFDAIPDNENLKVIVVLAFVVLLRGQVESTQLIFVLLIYLYAYHAEKIIGLSGKNSTKFHLRIGRFSTGNKSQKRRRLTGGGGTGG